MSKPKKIIRSIAVPDEDYQEMMKDLQIKGVYYISDKEGKTDEVKLIDGKPVEISTGREIKSMSEVTKMASKSVDGKMYPLTKWGQLMTCGELVYSKGNTKFFKFPGVSGYVVFDVEKDQIVTIIPPPPTE